MIDEKKLIEEIEEYIEEYSDVDENGYHNLKWCAMMEALEVIKQQPKIGEWILCSERLPEHEEKVLTCKNGHIEIHEYDKKRNMWIDLRTNWAWSAHMVNAWQPLPKPWKGE